VLFWLGNAYYGKRDYKNAIVSFRSLRRPTRTAARAPEALLSIANCQVELKDNAGGAQDHRRAGQGLPEVRGGAGRDGERLAALK
jgi:hypothetical protein